MVQKFQILSKSHPKQPNELRAYRNLHPNGRTLGLFEQPLAATDIVTPRRNPLARPRPQTNYPHRIAEYRG